MGFLFLYPASAAVLARPIHGQQEQKEKKINYTTEGLHIPNAGECFIWSLRCVLLASTQTGSGTEPLRWRDGWGLTDPSWKAPSDGGMNEKNMFFFFFDYLI